MNAKELLELALACDSAHRGAPEGYGDLLAACREALSECAKEKERKRTTADIPKVRVRDPDTGKILAEGYYFEMPETCYAMHVPGGTPIRTVRGVVSWEMTDWGMRNRIRIREVTPPHKIEVVNKGEIND